jgi:hypothetical protein
MMKGGELAIVTAWRAMVSDESLSRLDSLKETLTDLGVLIIDRVIADPARLRLGLFSALEVSGQRLTEGTATEGIGSTLSPSPEKDVVRAVLARAVELGTLACGFQEIDDYIEGYTYLSRGFAVAHIREISAGAAGRDAVARRFRQIIRRYIHNMLPGTPGRLTGGGTMFRDRSHKSIYMRPLERISGLPSPYGLLEGLGCLHRERRGPGRGGPPIPFPPREWILNEGIAQKVIVGFAGDVLDTRGLPARVGADVSAFYSDCDAVVANFESTITDLPGHGTSVRHIPQIVDALAEVFVPGRTFLSVANNHAGDYPAEVLLSSIRLLEDRGFSVFGLEERPFVDPCPALRVVGATDWSNAACDGIAMLDPRSTPRFMRPGALNLLFPHWGFELELNPRRSMVRKARAWLAKGFNAIVAHHGHTPRALYAEPGRDFGPAALVVDSLGDFVCGFPRSVFVSVWC